MEIIKGLNITKNMFVKFEKQKRNFWKKKNE